MKGICPRHGQVTAFNVKHPVYTENTDDYRCVLCAEPIDRLIMRGDEPAQNEWECLKRRARHYSVKSLSEGESAGIKWAENSIEQLLDALEQAFKFVDGSIKMTQTQYDEPFEPATRWDHDATILCAGLFSLLDIHRPKKPE